MSIHNITAEFLSMIKKPLQEKKLKYLIVVPPIVTQPDMQYRFPVGIALVSAALKASGREVMSVNLTYKSEPLQYIRDLIVQNNVDVIATGGLCTQYDYLKEICDTAKSVRPSIITVVGGGIITAAPETTMEAIESADVGIIGEGEITINALAYALEMGNDLSEVEGIIYRDAQNKWAVTKMQKEITDLDIVPFPDYDSLGLEEMMSKKYCEPPMQAGRKNATIIAGRSCKFRCTFCFHPAGAHYRQRSLTNIFKEIDWLMDKYSIDSFVFQDEMFIDNEETILEFCERIRPYNIGWQMQTRVDTVNRTILTACKEAGCYEIFLGLESADNHILKSMRKNITVEQFEKAADLALEIGIPVAANLIFGDVEETAETISNSISWWEAHPQYDIKLGWIRVYPGSTLYNNAVRQGIIKDPVAFLKDLCPQINISKMSDEEYWKWVDKVSILSIKSRDKLMSSSISLARNTSTTVNAQYKCVNCGNTSLYSGIYSMFKDITYQCPYCGDSFVISAINYVDKAYAREAVHRLVHGHKVGIWAAVGHAISPILEIIPELASENVWLINQGLENVVLCGKKIFKPDIITLENIDTIICPNVETNYIEIRDTCKRNYPSVKTFLHISEILIKYK